MFVYEAAEAISSQQPDGRVGGRGSAPCGRVLAQRTVRAVGVVIREVLLQHYREVARSGDQSGGRGIRGRRVPIQRSAIAFARGARTGCG
jgi:hypothetical protein